MNTHAITAIAERSAGSTEPLHIVLTYDLPSMATATRKFLEGFLAKWAGEIDIHVDEWSFTEIEHPKCRAEALELGKNCDIFIAALSGAADLPVSFQEWLSDWFQSRAQIETAFVLFVASCNARRSNLSGCSSLAIQAREKGLSFFTTTIPLPEPAVPATAHSKALLARLGAINADLLPDFSGIND